MVLIDLHRRNLRNIVYLELNLRSLVRKTRPTSAVCADFSRKYRRIQSQDAQSMRNRQVPTEQRTSLLLRSSVENVYLSISEVQ